MEESWAGQRPLVLTGDASEHEDAGRVGFVDKGEVGSQRQLLDGFILGMPPSANVYWRTRPMYSAKMSRHIAVTYVSDEAKAYKEHVAQVITEARKRYWTPHPLSFKVVVCFGTNGRADPDNRIKPLFDALKDAQFMKDDCQVHHHAVRRGPLVKGGRVIVSCWEILPDAVDALTWVKLRE